MLDSTFVFPLNGRSTYILSLSQAQPPHSLLTLLYVSPYPPTHSLSPTLCKEIDSTHTQWQLLQRRPRRLFYILFYFSSRRQLANCRIAHSPPHSQAPLFISSFDPIFSQDPLKRNSTMYSPLEIQFLYRPIFFFFIFLVRLLKFEEMSANDKKRKLPSFI